MTPAVQAGILSGKANETLIIHISKLTHEQAMALNAALRERSFQRLPSMSAKAYFPNIR